MELIAKADAPKEEKRTKEEADENDPVDENDHVDENDPVDENGTAMTQIHREQKYSHKGPTRANTKNKRSAQA